MEFHNLADYASEILELLWKMNSKVLDDNQTIRHFKHKLVTT